MLFLQWILIDAYFFNKVCFLVRKFLEETDQQQQGVPFKQGLWENGLLHLKPLHPCGKFTISIPQGECDFKMDWHGNQFHLKFTPPLCNILVQSTSEGVLISCGSILWATPIKTNTPCVKILQWILLYSDCLWQESNFLASTSRVTALCMHVCCIICECDCVMVIRKPTRK